MVNTRTYKETVEIAVNWWIEKSFKTCQNQNNGDKSEAGAFWSVYANSLARRAQSSVTEDKITIFREELTRILLELEQAHPNRRTLYVDYHPNVGDPLDVACKSAGIDTACLPCKTVMHITADNIIEYSYGYQGAWETL